MRAEVLAGLSRVATLVPASGFVDVLAGVSHPWNGGTSMFLRAEGGWRPTANTALFGFTEVDSLGLMAGVGAKVDL